MHPSLLRLRYRAKAALFDWSFDPTLSWLTAASFFVASVVLRRMAPALAFSSSLRAHYVLLRSGRYDVASSALYARVERSIAATIAHRPERLDLERTRATDGVTDAVEISGLVLKLPRRTGGRVTEKGVLLLANNERARAFAERVGMPALLEDYALVIETSWAGYANRDILYFTRFAPHRVVVMASDDRDGQFLERLGANLHPVTYGCSDWVHPMVFRPLDGVEKQFDAVMVARWALMKRHHALFRAVQRLDDPSFRLALVGRRLEISAEGTAIRSLLDAYGIARQVTIYEELTQDDVNVVLNQAKVNVLLSRHEGSNRSLFEGFFAGVPGLALASNVGVRKAYFTPETGRLVAERDFAAALTYFRTHWGEYAPRAWAERNIAPEVTTAKLNALLRQWALERGEEWTRDVVAKYNAPRLRYYPDAEAAHGFPTMTELIARYPRA